MVLVPVVGGVIVGLMARFGSDKIRGHGIPEAIEAILLNRARVEPKIAVLKPISAAIAIGSGGPFGAEGPIIMTGGAFGSLVAQWIHLTDAERTTLLVAGAAAGMSATFADAVGGDPAGGGTAALRVAAAQPDPGGLRQRYCRIVRVLLLGPGPLSHACHAVRISPRGRDRGAGSRGWWLALPRRHEPDDVRIRRPVRAAARCIGCGGRRSAGWVSVSAGCFSRAAWAWAMTTSQNCCAAMRHSDLLLGTADLQVADVGVLAGFGHLGWRTGAAADDRWRAGRAGRAFGACNARNAGPLGATWHGCDAFRFAGSASHGNSLQPRTDTFLASDAAVDAGMY